MKTSNDQVSPTLVNSGSGTFNRTYGSNSHSRSNTRGNVPTGQPREVVIMQKRNEKFDGIAGFDGRGGMHGSGGHSGNQIKPKQLNPDIEFAQSSVMKAATKMRVSPAAVANQQRLMEQAYNTNQKLFASNREQRAVSFYKHNGQENTYAQDYKNYNDVMALGKMPAQIQMIQEKKLFNTIENKNPLQQAKMRQHSTIPMAGYDKLIGGPQHVNTQQFYGIHQDEGLPNVQSFSGIPSINRHQRHTSEIPQLRESLNGKGENLFKGGPININKFSEKVSHLMTGERPPMEKPANPQNKVLTTINSHSNLSQISKIQNTFQQVPFWKNLNDQSIMSSQINKSARKDNKYIDLDTTRPSVENYPKFSIFDRGTPEISKLLDGGPSVITDGGASFLQDQSTFRDPSKFTTERPRDNSELKAALNQNLRTLTPMDMSQQDVISQVDNIHMYDSILLSQKPDLPQKRKKMNILEGSSSKVNIQIPGKTFDTTKASTLRPINQNSLSPKAKYFSSINFEEQEEHSEMASSSAQSVSHYLNIGGKQVETMRGNRLTHLSPITKKMNKIAMRTMNQIQTQQEAMRMREELRENLKQLMIEKLANGDKTKVTADDLNQNKDPKKGLKENSQQIKILKNEMKSIVAPDEQKYNIMIPDNPNYITVEVLPDCLPVFLKIPCSNLRSPCQFEIQMGTVNAIHVMMSTSHQFPGEEKDQREAERLIIKELYPQASEKNEKKEYKKNSILLLEASAKAEARYSKELLEKPHIQQFINEQKIKKKHFNFAKTDYKDNFDENDQIYLKFVSQEGGTIKIKGAFPNDYGGFGQPDANEMGMLQEKKKVTANPDDIVEELDTWCQENMKTIADYKYLFEQGFDYIRANKTERLNKMSFQNQPFEHHQKMMKNFIKREQAAVKANHQIETKYYKNKKNLSKWEDYRENKIELTAIFIRVLKKKNKTRRWIIAQKAGQIYAKWRENVYIRRALNHILFTSYRVAMRFKNTYMFRYQRQYGFDMTQRRRNELRRTLNFAAITKYSAIIKDTTQYLGHFIFKTILVENTSARFKLFNDSLLKCQEIHRNLLETRNLRYAQFYLRLLVQKEFFITTFAKKKKNAKAQKMIKALKKIFDKKKQTQEDVKMIRSQWDLMGTRMLVESMTLYKSIDVRALTLTQQLLTQNTLKDDEGVKIMKPKIEELKTQTEKLIKQVILKQKKVEKLERDIWGISDKEIKDNKKAAGFRRPDPAIVKLFELHKYDTSKYIKDDKTVAACKKWMKKQHKKRLGEIKLENERAKKGPVDEEEPEESPQKEGEGDEEEVKPEGEGEGEQDPEMEGMEGEMEGEMDPEMEGEMEGEMDPDMEGDMEEAEGDETLNKDGSQAELDGTGDADMEMDEGDMEMDETGSPGPKKKKSVSKPKKKKSATDEDKVEVIKLKESTKVKKKMILDEKLEIPASITQYIEENYPDEGINEMSAEEVIEVVREHYRVPEKKKLQRFTHKNKQKYNVTHIHKFLVHLCVNIGPQTGINQDIATDLKDAQVPEGKEEGTSQPEEAKQEAPVEAESPLPKPEDVPATEGSPEQQVSPDATQDDLVNIPVKTSTPPQKPLQMQPCLKKKPSGASKKSGSQEEDPAFITEQPEQPPPEEELVGLDESQMEEEEYDEEDAE